MSGEPYRHEYNWSDPDSFTTAVVEAIVEAADLEMTEFALSDHVDPDALDALFRPRLDGTPRAKGSVSFFVGCHQVVARADGEVLVYPNAGESNASETSG